jgi:hypothetical protein
VFGAITAVDLAFDLHPFTITNTSSADAYRPILGALAYAAFDVVRTGISLAAAWRLATGRWPRWTRVVLVSLVMMIVQFLTGFLVSPVVTGIALFAPPSWLKPIRREVITGLIGLQWVLYPQPFAVGNQPRIDGLGRFARAAALGLLVSVPRVLGSRLMALVNGGPSVDAVCHALLNAVVWPSFITAVVVAYLAVTRRGEPEAIAA